MPRELGPVEPAPPAPQPHVVPRMSLGYGFTAAKPKAWPVTDAELVEINEWLPSRLKGRWKHLADESFYSWLRSQMNDRTRLLIRSENIVGLFYTERDALDPVGHVVEKFVRCRSKKVTKEEQAAFYTVVYEWAKALGVSEFVFAIDSDCTLTGIGADAEGRKCYAVVF